MWKNFTSPSLRKVSHDLYLAMVHSKEARLEILSELKSRADSVRTVEAENDLICHDGK
jgi:hypothetical protein